MALPLSTMCYCPLLQVQKKIPNKDTPIVVGCSNGTTYSIDALELLDEAGYTNLVGLKGCACLQAG